MVSRASVEVEERDRGFDGLARRLDELSLEVVIGVLDDAEPYPDGTPVKVVLAANEYGTPSIPARAPMRTYYDGGGQKELGDASAVAVGDVVDGDEPGKAFEPVGELGVEGLRGTIEGGLSPALSPVTLANPGRDPRGIPLLDTGHLISQLDSEVRD